MAPASTHSELLAHPPGLTRARVHTPSGAIYGAHAQAGGAAGGKRGIGLNEERDQTLNQLLTELDGFEGRQGVLLLAATNRPEVRRPSGFRLLCPG